MLLPPYVFSNRLNNLDLTIDKANIVPRDSKLETTPTPGKMRHFVALVPFRSPTKAARLFAKSASTIIFEDGESKNPFRPRLRRVGLVGAARAAGNGDRRMPVHPCGGGDGLNGLWTKPPLAP